MAGVGSQKKLIIASGDPPSKYCLTQKEDAAPIAIHTPHIPEQKFLRSAVCMTAVCIVPTEHGPAPSEACYRRRIKTPSLASASRASDDGSGTAAVVVIVANPVPVMPSREVPARSPAKVLLDDKSKRAARRLVTSPTMSPVVNRVQRQIKCAG
jgi:hypothetical protein